MRKLFFLLGLFCFTSLLQAQGISLSGTVSGDGSLPLSGVVVTLQGLGISDTTDETGAFQIDNTLAAVKDNAVERFKPTISGKDLLFHPMRSQWAAWRILDHSGRVLFMQSGQHVDRAAYRIRLPELQAGAGIFYLELTLEGRITVLRYLNIPQVGFGTTSLETPRHALLKTATFIDTLVFAKSGYKTIKQAITNAIGTQTLTMNKAGGPERLGYLTNVGGIMKIGTCRLDGTDPQILNTPEVSIMEAAISPDGRRVAFGTREGYNPDINWKLYVMNIDGSGLEAIDRGTYFSWHANGNWLAWVNQSKVPGPDITMPTQIKATLKSADIQNNRSMTFNLMAPGTVPTIGESQDEYIYQTYWLPDSVPAVAATFMSTRSGAWRKDLMAVMQTVPATSYTSLANSDALDNDILFLGVTYDGTFLYKRATGSTTATGDPKYLYFSGSRNGLSQVNGPLFGGIFSPNASRVLHNGIEFLDPFGGGNKVTPGNLPKNIFGWYLAQE